LKSTQDPKEEVL